MNHIPHSSMISPWTRDRIEPRQLDAAEQEALRNHTLARQQVRNAQALVRASMALLPDKHVARADLGLFVDELDWTIETYLAPAMDAIQALPGDEAQDEEDAANV